MSIDERIERFWVKSEGTKLDTKQIALWFAILKNFVDAGFPMRHEIKNKDLCRILDIGLRGMISARNGLVEKGLIGFEAGNARKQPTYIIDDKMITQQVVLRPSKERVKRPSVELPKKVDKSRTKEITKPTSLFKENKVERRMKVEQEPPSIEKVMAICLENGMSADEAREFYHYYNAQGWFTSSGQKIKRIDSMVNRWMSNEKRKNQHGINRSNSEKRMERNNEIAADILKRYM